MVNLLVTVLVVALVIGLLVWIVGLLPIPQPFRNVALAIIGVLAIVWLLSVSGMLAGGGWRLK